MRWVMHVDMDAFFASVEQLDNPQYRGKPLIVGGKSHRGVVSTCSYEEREYGVHSAMPIVQAKRLCPPGIFVSGRMGRYVEVSQQMMKIFAEFSPCVEPLSIDEAFLDLSGMEHLVGDITLLGRKIKMRIKEVTGLTASVGLAPNKFLAKLGSDLRKPDGLVIISAHNAKEFIAPLPVNKIFGIGKKANEALQKIGIITIGQLAACDELYLKNILGNNTALVQNLARGIDDRPVENTREAKSIGKETTYMEDLLTQEKYHDALWDLSQQVGWRVRNICLAGRTVTLKVKYRSFKSVTRSITTEVPVSADEDIFALVEKLIGQIKWAEPVRLLGVSVSKLVPAGELLLDFARDEKQQKRNAALDALKNKFGEHIIKRGK
ncbi:MAG: DNA polymerase IV [Acidaminococcaceae bacterium]|nr:DNA polymerase IV [Acidaminococcaceae bacterium]